MKQQEVVFCLHISPSPVLARLLLEELIKLQHLLPGDDVDAEFGQHLVHQPQVVVDQALPVASHVVAGPPEDEDGVLAGVQQLVATAQDPLHAGVSDDAQGGAAAHVPGVTPGGRGVVHADDALGAVDLFTASASDEVTRAGDQGAGPTVHPERLQRKKKKKGHKTCKQMEKYNSPRFINRGSTCGRIFMLVLQANWPEVPQTPFFSGVQKAPQVLFNTSLLQKICSADRNANQVEV